ncbi:MAG: hypothetical protein QM504_06945 [Pseudomonadota bacterium]
MLKSLKIMMNGLSAQYAGDYLSSTEKENILSDNQTTTEMHLDNYEKDKSNIIQHRKKHIALLCNDITNQNVLSYVLENSEDCSIDILYHGAHKDAEPKSFYKHARSSFIENNVEVNLVKLINDSIDDIKNYLLQQRSLQYLVTDTHDKLIKQFLNNKVIKDQIYVPIVLIN